MNDWWMKIVASRFDNDNSKFHSSFETYFFCFWIGMWRFPEAILMIECKMVFGCVIFHYAFFFLLLLLQCMCNWRHFNDDWRTCRRNLILIMESSRAVACVNRIPEIFVRNCAPTKMEHLPNKCASRLSKSFILWKACLRMQAQRQNQNCQTLISN